MVLHRSQTRQTRTRSRLLSVKSIRLSHPVSSTPLVRSRCDSTRRPRRQPGSYDCYRGLFASALPAKAVLSPRRSFVPLWLYRTGKKLREPARYVSMTPRDSSSPVRFLIVAGVASTCHAISGAEVSPASFRSSASVFRSSSSKLTDFNSVSAGRSYLRSPEPGPFV